MADERKVVALLEEIRRAGRSSWGLRLLVTGALVAAAIYAFAIIVELAGG